MTEEDGVVGRYGERRSPRRDCCYKLASNGNHRLGKAIREHIPGHVLSLAAATTVKSRPSASPFVFTTFHSTRLNEFSPLLSFHLAWGPLLPCPSVRRTT